MNIQRLFFGLIYSLFVFAFIIGCCLIFIYALGAPDMKQEQTFTIVDHQGEILHDGEEKITHIDELPAYIVEGMLLAEDRHFYDHYGLHMKGIARALVRNIEAGALKEGASTITQQLARNLYLSHEKTWTRKLKELYYTIRLEMFYSKDELLTAYMNTIYFGHGAYGIKDAANLYFDKKASDLTIAEATMLIGIPKGPTYYSPYNDFNNATERQRYILKQLLRAEVITEANYYEAKSEPLTLAEKKEEAINSNNYFIDYVWQEATQQAFNEEELLQQEVTIETTLDRSLQEENKRTIEAASISEDDLELGTIALDPQTGAIRQMTGGKNYTTSSFNRAVHAKRMVGSTFKPFVYYAALEHGFTATTMLQSEPTVFTMGQDTYEPSNYHDYYAYQPISLAQALALSDNIYAVKTHLFLSAATVIETTKQFGITASLPEVPSLALGSASIPLIEMVQAYAMIANGGYDVTPYAIEKITAKDGRILYEKEETKKKRIFDKETTFLLTHLMTGMFDRRLNGYMEVTGASMIDQLHHEYAGKSGTTSSDSWMIGFSPKLVLGTWTGFDDNRKMQKQADKAFAKELWANLMQFAHEAEEEKLTFSVPEDIVAKVVDVETGLLATEDCDVTRTTYFKRGTEPTIACTHETPVDSNPASAQPKEEETILQKLLPFLP